MDDSEAEVIRLTEWLDFFQDEAVVNFDDKRVGLLRLIKEEGLTLKNFIGEDKYALYKRGKQARIRYYN